MNPNEARLVRNTALTVLALVALRLVAAAWTPLTFDEAYYWMWSKHLAGGYYDHPPMVAVVIRLGTMIAGDTELGVRLVSILLALPMSWAVYRATAILFGSRARGGDRDDPAQRHADGGGRHPDRHAGRAAAGGLELRAVVCLAKVLETGRGAWWLAVGAAVGAALLSKYTALFFGPAILIWLIARSEAAALADLAMALSRRAGRACDVCAGHSLECRSSLGILHQADGPRADRGFQAGLHRRIDPDADRVRNAAGVGSSARWGFMRCSSAATGALAARVLINAMFWTIVAYFIWHSLHARVEANWFAPVYPAFAIAAAVAANLMRWEPRWQRVADFCLRWALPTGIVMFALLIVQANTGVLSGYRRDATVRSVGVGWRELAAEIEAVRARVGATCVLAPDYGTTGWLAFYLPKGTCVAQQNQRIRWVNMPEPDPALLAGKLLYVDEVWPIDQPVEAHVSLASRRSPKSRASAGRLTIETYALDVLEGAKGDVFDRSPPPELE